MARVNVFVDGQPAGVLPDFLVKDGEVHVPLGAFCACIGARVEVRGGRTVVCSGDLCIPVAVSGSADRGDAVYAPLSALVEPLGLGRAFPEGHGELRVMTKRMPEGAFRAGGPAPDFTLPDLSGNPVSVRDFRGHKVAFYVWASW